MIIKLELVEFLEMTDKILETTYTAPVWDLQSEHDERFCRWLESADRYRTRLEVHDISNSQYVESIYDTGGNIISAMVVTHDGK